MRETHEDLTEVIRITSIHGPVDREDLRIYYAIERVSPAGRVTGKQKDYLTLDRETEEEILKILRERIGLD